MKQINVAEKVNPHFDFLFRQYNLFSDVVLSGGRASTKSSAISIFLVAMFLNDKNAHVVVFRKVAKTLSTSVYEQIKWAIEELGVASRFQFKKSPMKIVDKVTGTAFHFFGVDDPMKLKSPKIASGYVSMLWFEESAEFKDWDDINTVRLSYTREKLPEGRKVLTLYSYNPPRNPYDWINDWVEERKTYDGWIVDHSTYLDDTLHFLSDSYIAEVEQTKVLDYDYYRWQFLGEAVGLGTNIFNMDMFHALDTIPSDDPITRLYYSVDGGHQQSATTCLLFGITAKQKVILLDTYYYSPAGQVEKLAPSQLSTNIFEFIRGQKDSPWGHVTVVNRTIDSAEGALRNQYRLDHRIDWHPVAKQKKTIMIDNVHSILGAGRFYYLDTDNNQVFIEQAKQYRWDDKTVNSDDPRVVKEDDHTLDAFQYFVLDNARDLKLRN